MIGVCKVPLLSLASSCSIHERYPIKSPSGQQTVGELEIKISVMELEVMKAEGAATLARAANSLMYSKEWEQEIVMQIARKLASLNCEIEMMFGLFSQGARNCTKEDFKHVCLHRLRLSADGLSERELDMVLSANEYTRDSNIIEKQDFISLFSGAIVTARNER